MPRQQVLTTNGNWYQKTKENNHYLVKHYKTPTCGYCLSCFSKNAGTASGLTGGADLSLILLMFILFIVFNRYRSTEKKVALSKEVVAA